jgi:hypothetical protein
MTCGKNSPEAEVLEINITTSKGGVMLSSAKSRKAGKTLLQTLFFFLLVTQICFAQGSWNQTTTAEFNTNINFNIHTGNDEMKLTNDVGNGLDGDFYVPPGGTVKTDNVKTFVTGNNPSGQNAIQVSSSSGFQIGEEVLLITMQDNNPDLNNNIAGQYEFKRIINKTATALVFQDNLIKSYNSSGKKHQVLKVPNYNNVTIDVGGVLTCDDWDGYIGGIVCFRSKGHIQILALAKIDCSIKGFRGGIAVTGTPGFAAEGIFGLGVAGPSSNSNGGGGGNAYYSYGGGGGGGSYGTFGTKGQPASGGGDSGIVVGTQFLSKLLMGGGGGSGNVGYIGSGSSGTGGNGGGIIYLSCDSLQIIGKLVSDGGNGGNPINATHTGGSGAGSGGSIYIISTKVIYLGNNFVTAQGGIGSNGTEANKRGGNGGLGRIRVDAPAVNGTSHPPVGYIGTSYAYLGTSTTPIITKPADQFWGILNFDVNTGSPGTSIAVDVLNSDGSVLLDSVPSGSNLNYLGLQQSKNSIKLMAGLQTSYGNQTPILFDWAVEWTITDVNDIPSSMPENYSVSQNYPNPFNPSTTIKYSIPEINKVMLKLFNLLGEEVATLVNEEKVAGYYTVEFNAATLPSGVYFYQLQAGSFTETKKMILLR